MVRNTELYILMLKYLAWQAEFSIIWSHLLFQWYGPEQYSLPHNIHSHCYSSHMPPDIFCDNPLVWRAASRPFSTIQCTHCPSYPCLGITSVKLFLIISPVIFISPLQSSWLFQLIHVWKSWCTTETCTISYLMLIWDMVSLCTSGWPESHYVNHAAPKLTESYLPLPVECWC